MGRGHMSNFFYILSQDHETLGILQNIISVQWLEEYQNTGEVKIEVMFTPENQLLLTNENKIYNTDSNIIAEICNVEINDQSEKGATMTVRAIPTIEAYAQRVLYGTYIVDNAETAMYQMTAYNRRGLPISNTPPEGHTETAGGMEISWGSVLNALIKVAEMTGLGFQVEYLPEDTQQFFRIYKGIDRTNINHDSYVGFFSFGLGNIDNVVIRSGINNYKNVAIVQGEGEGAARKIVEVSIGDPVGVERRELSVDARDLQKKYQVADASGNLQEREYTDAEYEEVLRARGLEKLAENLREMSISVEANQASICYGVDYGLGDRLPIIFDKYKITATCRVASATRIYETSGNRVSLVLDNFENFEID